MAIGRRSWCDTAELLRVERGSPIEMRSMRHGTCNDKSKGVRGTARTTRVSRSKTLGISTVGDVVGVSNAYFKIPILASPANHLGPEGRVRRIGKNGICIILYTRSSSSVSRG
ncbi:hypothetical protein E4U53_000539 [Claviceps sorghi]|nr:hypothetical protein E4U53_000539 [Claviceps sorghi]